MSVKNKLSLLTKPKPSPIQEVKPKKEKKEKHNFNIVIEVELVKKFKQLALDRNTSVAKLVVEAMKKTYPELE